MDTVQKKKKNLKYAQRNLNIRTKLITHQEKKIIPREITTTLGLRKRLETSQGRRNDYAQPWWK